MKYKVKRDDLIYPELSYEIVGCAFEVAKEIGFGHKESVYQNAMKVMFDSKDIKYSQQVYYPVTFKGKTIGKNFFDFLVDNKIIVELKKNMRFSKSHIDQVLNYLKVSRLQLALLITFGKEGASFKRIVNIEN